MGEAAEKAEPKAVRGKDAQRIKREALGIGDRRKHHSREATPLKGHAKGPDTHHRIYRFRFYPTAEQAVQLEKTFGACRWVYNEGLALRSGAWEQERKKKGRSRDSAGYVRTGFKWVEDPERLGTGLITLAKQSVPLDIRWSRALPAGVDPVRLSVTRDRAGRYFVSALVEERIPPLPAAFRPGSQEPGAVGLDLGPASLVTLDDGTKLDHPRLLKRYGEKLARLQRELHKKVKGSNNRDKIRQKIARVYALILRPARGQGRRRKARLNEAIIDAGWGELLRQLRYKCEWYGRTLVIVDRFFPSTRRCSACHAKGPRMDVSVREWTCAECAAGHDRDVNAAVNLRDEGMRLYWLVSAGLPPGNKAPTVIKASELEECSPAA